MTLIGVKSLGYRFEIEAMAASKVRLGFQAYK